MDATQLNSALRYVNSLVARALNVDNNNTVAKQISKIIFELAKKNTITTKPVDLKNVDSEIVLLTAPFKDIVNLRQESESRKGSPYVKIEKICENLDFGELIIKVQNGKPVFIESIKKQVKIN